MEKQEVRDLRQKFSRCKAMLVCEQGCWGSSIWREEAVVEGSVIGGQKPDQEKSDVSSLEVDIGLFWLYSG